MLVYKHDSRRGNRVSHARDRRSAGPEGEVLLFKPEPFGADYRCGYQIVGIGDEKIHSAVGVDAFQALRLALGILPTQLAVLKREYPGLQLLDDD